MSRPSSHGDFDVVTGPPAPIRKIEPAIPAPAPDRPPAAPALDDARRPAGGKTAPPAR